MFNDIHTIVVQKCGKRMPYLIGKMLLISIQNVAFTYTGGAQTTPLLRMTYRKY